jgi:lipooligosaccharide transport system ATP-binding protein
MILIEAKNLTKKFGDLVAVDNIDFSIEQEETFGFLGPNGAGKTTTMKMIYCFINVTSGELRILGMDVTKEPRKIKKILGVVPQEDSLDPDLTVYGNLITYSRYYDIPPKVAKERAEKLLELMQLTDKKSKVIDDLSGGMKRRLILARGLINEPKILILDEPTTGLDPQARHLVWQKLRQLKNQGITIILTTHYMDEASQLCDRLVIMNEGKILDCDSPQELVKKHIGERALEIQNANEKLGEIVKERLGRNCQVEMFGDTIFIYYKESINPLPFLNDLKLERIFQRDATLEDVFLKLTGRTLRE